MMIKFVNKFQVKIKLVERLHLWGFGHLVECSIPSNVKQYGNSKYVRNEEVLLRFKEQRNK